MIEDNDNIVMLRFCDDTGEPMIDGWCWGDGLGYNKYAKDVIAELKKPEYEIPPINANGKPKTDDDWLESGCDLDLVYWTDWYDEALEALEDDDVSEEEKTTITILLAKASLDTDEI